MISSRPPRSAPIGQVGPGRLSSALPRGFIFRRHITRLINWAASPEELLGNFFFLNFVLKFNFFLLFGGGGRACPVARPGPHDVVVFGAIYHTLTRELGFEDLRIIRCHVLE